MMSYENNARGSALECGVHLDICALSNLADPILIQRVKNLLEREVSMLTRLGQSQGRGQIGRVSGQPQRLPPLAQAQSPR
jgi:hypothetical protein